MPEGVILNLEGEEKNEEGTLQSSKDIYVFIAVFVKNKNKDRIWIKFWKRYK